MLKHYRLRSDKQDLVGEGHSYDVLTAETDQHEQATVYFNIDKVVAIENAAQRLACPPDPRSPRSARPRVAAFGAHAAATLCNASATQHDERQDNRRRRGALYSWCSTARKSTRIWPKFSGAAVGAALRGWPLLSSRPTTQVAAAHPQPEKPGGIAMLIYPDMTALDLIVRQHLATFRLTHLVAKTKRSALARTATDPAGPRSSRLLRSGGHLFAYPAAAWALASVMTDIETINSCRGVERLPSWQRACARSMILARLAFYAATKRRRTGR